MSGVVDGLNYIFLTNPVSQGVLSTAGSLARKTGIISSTKTQAAKATQESAKIMSNALPLWKLAGRNIYFLRLAGLSGASAVILGAYGSHRHYNEEKGQSRTVFETANRFHFFHSIALMGVPLCRKPLMTGSLMLAGTILFSGTCYYRAFTGNTIYSKMTPIGGICLIFAWLSMLL